MGTIYNVSKSAIYLRQNVFTRWSHNCLISRLWLNVRPFFLLLLYHTFNWLLSPRTIKTICRTSSSSQRMCTNSKGLKDPITTCFSYRLFIYITKELQHCIVGVGVVPLRYTERYIVPLLSAQTIVIYYTLASWTYLYFYSILCCLSINCERIAYGVSETNLRGTSVDFWEKCL